MFLNQRHLKSEKLSGVCRACGSAEEKSAWNPWSGFPWGRFFRTQDSELHITLPELCRYSPDDKEDTMIYFLSMVDDLSVLSNVFLSRFSFVVLLFLRKGKELPVNRLQFEVASCKAADGPGGGEEGSGSRRREEGEEGKERG